ncbi:hypothetical protein GH733_011674 [Mirounga leonina]|nr:hypothetical protein GH733_011674 [Mirounga leonina]
MASKEEQAVQNVNQENSGKDEKEQGANEEALVLPLEAGECRVPPYVVPSCSTGGTCVRGLESHRATGKGERRRGSRGKSNLVVVCRQLTLTLFTTTG